MHRAILLRRSRGRLAASLLALIALAAPAGAQVRAARLTLDNDAYALWDRADYEYTNGVALSVEVAGGPVWARRLAAGAAACTGAESPDAPCSSTTFAIGQKIYAPRHDGPELAPGERPYAGWLYLSATGRLASAARRRSAGVEVGVTGPPSLAQAVHTGWHRATGFWTPQGWQNQLAFEPGIAVHYQEAVLGELRGGGRRLAAVAPEWGASLGSLLTAAHAAVRASAGMDVPHPWSAAADRAAGPVSVYALAAARGDAVARNLFLDGSTFGAGPRVERRPFVFSYELGGGVRYRSLTLEYRARHRGREYRTEPGGHTYAAIELAWRPAAAPTPSPLGANPAPPAPGSHAP
ncbi:MAG TPA: lipid A deacylase LpxR family protein [Longimicrobiaceae bacterium]|nr:lipid A deacylase LpxR family protein [Longimicrobiaceae bacterium]